MQNAEPGGQSNEYQRIEFRLNGPGTIHQQKHIANSIRSKIGHCGIRFEMNGQGIVFVPQTLQDISEDVLEFMRGIGLDSVVLRTQISEQQRSPDKVTEVSRSNQVVPEELVLVA